MLQIKQFCLDIHLSSDFYHKEYFLSCCFKISGQKAWRIVNINLQEIDPRGQLLKRWANSTKFSTQLLRSFLLCKWIELSMKKTF